MDELINWAKQPLAVVAGLPITPALLAVVVIIVLLIYKKR